jgi:hypothetical protein
MRHHVHILHSTKHVLDTCTFMKLCRMSHPTFSSAKKRGDGANFWGRRDATAPLTQSPDNLGSRRHPISKFFKDTSIYSAESKQCGGSFTSSLKRGHKQSHKFWKNSFFCFNDP